MFHNTPFYNPPPTIEHRSTKSTGRGSLILLVDIICLSEEERLDIRILQRCGDKIRSYEKVVHLFYDNQPYRLSITKWTVFKTVTWYWDTSSNNDRCQKFKICTSIVEDVHAFIRKIAKKTGIRETSANEILIAVEFHRSKMTVNHELLYYDAVNSLEFSEEILRLCDRNRKFSFWTNFLIKIHSS